MEVGSRDLKALGCSLFLPISAHAFATGVDRQNNNALNFLGRSSFSSVSGMIAAV